MCYTVYLSTNSQQDLTKYNSTLVQFEAISSEAEDSVIRLLKNPHKWYIGSKAGCSCTFRHLLSTELGFGEPVDWYHEDQDALEATKALFRLIAQLIGCGYQLDCLDIWASREVTDIVQMDVHLSLISETSFRFFENHHFIFTKD